MSRRTAALVAGVALLAGFSSAAFSKATRSDRPTCVLEVPSTSTTRSTYPHVPASVGG